MHDPQMTEADSLRITLLLAEQEADLQGLREDGDLLAEQNEHLLDWCHRALEEFDGRAVELRKARKALWWTRALLCGCWAVMVYCGWVAVQRGWW